ncbi:hypothetical protein LAZ67_19001536 [Cordylochernes scorpioides]|uniref:ATP-dependent DNA helicase n=1 Tax=Cordylochernes scorpioides TaxID=51811 RepID=A0ABY6LHW4_9ARAC|nr:hypothetical protein LAZ67_19001536 [Cordylochernes scorpioides]
MDTTCRFCGALRWKDESSGMCCSNGKVRLPLIDLPTEPLRSLLSGENSDSVHFLRNIRKYNSCFQMTSFGAESQTCSVTFPTTFSIQGQVYHRIGSLMPSENQPRWPGVKRSDTIGRVYAVHVSNFECFCLRMLLHNIKGPPSFAYLKIVNGSQYETFRDTCAALELLENDNHWVVTMDEAILCQSPTRRARLPSAIYEKNSDKASLLRSCKLLVWDECTMAHKIALEVLDRTLQDIRDDPQPMGGLVVLLAGDFRQILPVVTRGTPADELNACLKSSYLWSHIVKMHLIVKIRVQLHNDTTAAQFADELLKIGEGQLETDSEVILIRNLDPPRLCNGTRLCITRMGTNVLQARILTGSFRGEEVLIPRIPIIPNDLPFKFRRLQFPVMVAFAMTINKSQGQTLQVVVSLVAHPHEEISFTSKPSIAELPSQKKNKQQDNLHTQRKQFSPQEWKKFEESRKETYEKRSKNINSTIQFTALSECSAEEHLSSIAKIIGHENIHSVGKMNSQAVVSVANGEQALLLINNGFAVRGNTIYPTPLFNPPKKYILSGILAFIPVEEVTKAMAPFGEILSIRPLPFPTENPLFKHLSSLRREVVLKRRESTDMPAIIPIDYMQRTFKIFVGEDTICLGCKRHGHIKSKCPFNPEIRNNISRTYPEAINPRVLPVIPGPSRETVALNITAKNEYQDDETSSICSIGSMDSTQLQRELIECEKCENPEVERIIAAIYERAGISRTIKVQRQLIQHPDLEFMISSYLERQEDIKSKTYSDLKSDQRRALNIKIGKMKQILNELTKLSTGNVETPSSKKRPFKASQDDNLDQRERKRQEKRKKSTPPGMKTILPLSTDMETETENITDKSTTSIISLDTENDTYKNIIEFIICSDDQINTIREMKRKNHSLDHQIQVFAETLRERRKNLEDPDSDLKMIYDKKIEEAEWIMKKWDEQEDISKEFYANIRAGIYP